MRTAFLGTSDFAVTVLERLSRSDHRPVLVVTRTDRPRGRGRRIQAPPVAEAARELGIELGQPGSVNEPEARERIAAAAPEVICICAFGGLINQFGQVCLGLMNVYGLHGEDPIRLSLLNLVQINRQC